VPAYAEVGLLQVEVEGVHDVVLVEVAPGVVAGLPDRPAEGVLQDREVARVHDVAAVAVARPHDAHLDVGLASRYGQHARVGEVDRPLDGPVVRAVGQGRGDSEEAAGVCGDVIGLRQPAHAQAQRGRYAHVAAVGLYDALPGDVPDDPAERGWRKGNR